MMVERARRHGWRTAAFALTGLAASACAGGVNVSDDEAVEILVLDGVVREEASCIVDSIDHTMDLAAVTGVSGTLSESDLSRLAAIAATCRVPVDFGGGSTGDEPEVALEVSEGGGTDEAIDAAIDGLLAGGLDRQIAECVRAIVSAADNPVAMVANPEFLAEAIRLCDR